MIHMIVVLQSIGRQQNSPSIRQLRVHDVPYENEALQDPKTLTPPTKHPASLEIDTNTRHTQKLR